MSGLSMRRLLRRFAIAPVVVVGLAAAIGTGGFASTAYEGRRVVEIDLADASPCLQSCASTFQECVPPVKTVRGLGLTPSALSRDFGTRKHKVRLCRREHESCSVNCNLTDARTIAVAEDFR